MHVFTLLCALHLRVFALCSLASVDPWDWERLMELILCPLVVSGHPQEDSPCLPAQSPVSCPVPKLPPEPTFGLSV